MRCKSLKTLLKKIFGPNSDKIENSGHYTRRSSDIETSVLVLGDE
jgi:hypothetical protein